MKTAFAALSLALLPLGFSATAAEPAAPAAAKPAASSASKVTFVVDGMSCESCAKKITKSLTALDGVTVDKVDPEAGTATVSFAAGKTKKDQAVAVITELGYEVTGEKLHIPVTGMSCAACAGKVKTALTAVSGVTVKKINPTEGFADVVIDSKKTSSEKVIAAINGTGFTAGEPK